jgi:glucokinase
VILGGDVGGTRTTLALLEPKDDALEIVRLENYLSREHASFGEIVAKFASGFTAPVTAGVAGPVVNRVSTTNLPWLVDGAKLASQLGLPTVALLNDIEAQAWSIEWLRACRRPDVAGGGWRPLPETSGSSLRERASDSRR